MVTKKMVSMRLNKKLFEKSRDFALQNRSRYRNHTDFVEKAIEYYLIREMKIVGYERNKNKRNNSDT